MKTETRSLIEETSTYWAAHTDYLTLRNGATLWLMGPCSQVTTAASPPDGVEFPILLGDGTVAMTKVISSGPSEIVIELEEGHLVLLTSVRRWPACASNFPGSEWIVEWNGSMSGALLN
jgi:hypothetical protein